MLWFNYLFKKVLLFLVPHDYIIPFINKCITDILIYSWVLKGLEHTIHQSQTSRAQWGIQQWWEYKLGNQASLNLNYLSSMAVSELLCTSVSPLMKWGWHYLLCRVIKTELLHIKLIVQLYIHSKFLTSDDKDDDEVAEDADFQDLSWQVHSLIILEHSNFYL